ALTLALDDAWSPRLDQSAADAELSLGGLSMATNPPAGADGKPVAAAPDPVELSQTVVTTKLAPGAAPSIGIHVAGKQQAAAFTVEGALDLVGLIGKDAKGKPALTPAALRPIGSVEITNLPTSLAALALPAPAGASGQGMDLPRLVREAVGPG